MIKFLKNHLLPAVFLVSICLVLIIYKGSDISGKSVGSVYDLSNSSARYALTEAIYENHSLFLNDTQARFASPDVVKYKDRFFSIFTPGISFLALPFYVFGKVFARPEITTHLLNSVFLIVNVYLIYILSKRFGAGKNAAIFAGVAFAFATNALPYSQTLTQHLVSSSILVFMLILSHEILNRKTLFLTGLLYSAGVIVDFPNAILGLPIIFYLASRIITITSKKINVINKAWVFFILGAIPFFVAFAGYNFATTSNFMKLAQSIGRTDEFSESPNLHLNQSQNSPILRSILPFNTRDQLNGLYILGFSDERSWLYYSPVILLGIIGIFLVIKERKNEHLAILGLSVVAVNFFVYSSFGDPWGGWAFGPRYLIPSAAILSSGLSIMILHFKRNFFVIFLISVLVTYGVWTNGLGALTTNGIPPKIEVENMPNHIPFTQELNYIEIRKGLNNSIAYQVFLHQYFSPFNFWIAYSTFVTLFLLGLLGIAVRSQNTYEK